MNRFSFKRNVLSVDALQSDCVDSVFAKIAKVIANSEYY